MPMPTMITVWTTAINRRMNTLLETSVPRDRGVALSRFRMPFSRWATSGMAAKMPSCMSAMARMLGTK